MVSLSFVLLLASGLLVGGTYFYKQSLQQEVDGLTIQLKTIKESLEVDLINKISDLSKRIDGANTLLVDHVVMSPFFSFLSETTLPNVRFVNFTYTDENALPSFSIAGIAKSYSTLAIQMDKLQKNRNIENLSVSNLTLGEKGVVNFDLKLQVNPDLLEK